MELISIINENKNKLFEELNLPFKVNLVEANYNNSFTISTRDHNSNSYTDKIVNLTTDKISFSFNQFLKNDLKVDIISESIKQIRQEVERFLIKNLINQFNPTDYIFIPPGKYQLESEKLDIFIRELLIKSNRLQTKNVIVSASLGSEISCINDFNYSTSSRMNKSVVNIYKIGTLYELDIYVDPYLKYDDNQIFLWDDVDCYLSFNSIIEKISPASFTTTTDIIFSYGLVIKNPNIIYYLRDENSPGYNLYISEMRDKKIDQILDGQ